MTTPTITVIDAIMGAGKTTFAHASMKKTVAAHPQAASRLSNPTWDDYASEVPSEASNDNAPVPAPRFIYVTPFLDEVQRAKDACPDLDFQDPRSIDGRPKWLHFEALLKDGQNIATTHALLPFLSDDGIQAIRDHGYRLVVDEALEGIDLHRTLTTKEIDHLLRERWIVVDPDTGAVRWIYGDHQGHRFEDVQRLARTGSLFLVEGKFLVWEFPKAALDAFREITILTYLFEGSTLSAYFRANDYPYRVLGIDRDGTLRPREEVNEGAIKAAIRQRLTVYEGPKNAIGAFRPKGAKRGSQKFTVAHLSGMSPEKMKTVATTVRKFIERDAKAPAKDVAWTTFKEFRERLTGRGFSDPDCFIPVNARASNDWCHKTTMIYLANRFPNPVLTRYIQDKGQDHSADLFALSEMLQWLWRGCIRVQDGPSMTVFIPSERMRSLLKAWLETDTIPELLERLDGGVGKLASPAA
ncbi:hypothetical protein [Roseospira goensis]|uniref:Uncharacterized protein n=1 Tax=Roseospira goensis TaxID=391922 RepID=A0A7W6S348_9PROT|nr:hypothetical protein [Roseospira goensis]MBB4287876.1 hypothetical protein [Roseospira goensis]